MGQGDDDKPFSRGELRLVDALAQRWSVTPSMVLAEDAGLVMGILGVIGDSAAESPPPSEDDLMRGLLVNQSKVMEG